MRRHCAARRRRLLALGAGRAQSGEAVGHRLDERNAPRDAVDMATQVTAIYEQAAERLAVLRKLAAGTSTDVALFARLYNGEERVTGARSKLECAVDDTLLRREVTALTAISARERAKRGTCLGLRTGCAPGHLVVRLGGE